MQDQLEALDAKREAESGQNHKTDSVPGTRPVRRCQPLPQKEPERRKDGHIAEALGRPLSTLLKYAGEIQRQVMPGSVLHDPQMPDPDRRIQQEQAHENRQPQSNRAIYRALLPDQKDDCQCQCLHSPTIFLNPTEIKAPTYPPSVFSTRSITSKYPTFRTS